MPYTYIVSEKPLEELVSHMKRAPRVAVDIEANTLYRYFPQVCLIQVTFQESTYVVDPLVGLDLSKFLKVLAGKPLILHAGDYDLRMLRHSYAFRPKKEVFDTMLAAQLLGSDELGLVAIAKRCLGVELTKTGQKSNWTRRPLSEAQLAYACDDTRYLEALADHLAWELHSLGRRRWHRETCARMVVATEKENGTDPEEAWRVKGWAALDRHHLVFLREFWRWRENEARMANRPPFKIMGNPQLLELTTWAGDNPDANVSNAPRLPRTCEGRRMGALADAMRSAAGMPREKWPKRRRDRQAPPPGPDCRAEVRALRTECDEIARELDIPPSVLAPRAALAGVARGKPRTVREIMTCGGMMRWQAELLAPAVKRVLGQTSK